ncbi:glycosyltransferase [Dysgonomonas sp. 520]|uniref:glycosyltransferase n=1 Tax=Dysgonomonas sp. 520 TaxID=2302931 RepID=UPI0013D126EC|nr:glycosyltransferase [Dysgonomonas sp. 520]NDW09224.1 glycosyltransferase [Dysgonomonas sp. 520]
MRKILIFNDCFYMGGTEVLLVNVLNHLAEKKCEVTLLLPNPSERNVLLSGVSSKIQIKYIYPKMQKGFKHAFFRHFMILFPRLYAKLVLKMDGSEYDQIVCFKDTQYSIVFSRMNMPKIQWVHNQPFIHEYKYKSLKVWLAVQVNKRHLRKLELSYNRFDEVVCVSDSCRDKYFEIYGRNIFKTDVKVLYNALNLDGIAEKSELQVPGLPDFNGMVFILVTRISPEKTVDRTVKMTRKLIDEGYDFRVMILGDGPEYEYINQLIKDEGLSDIMKMYGRVLNPFPYMKRADWLLCGSSRESFSLVLLEAISLGTPVLTTDCGGPEDVIAKGKYGLLLENSIDGVYQGMKKVLDNPQLKDYYNSLAPENLARFNYDNWIKEVDKLLQVENL